MTDLKKLRITALILLICFLFSSCSAVEKITSTQVIEHEESDTAYRTLSKSTEQLTKNDFLEFSFDKKTYSVNIKDITENYTWTSLQTKNTPSSFVVSLNLYTKNGIYTLNTQDNSVAFGTAEYKKENNTLTVNYILSDKAETAKKDYTQITSDDVYVAFSVKYTFSEQTMQVEVLLENALITPDAFIGEMTVLPLLGASGNDAENDYFLIPDGSGAVMHLKKTNVATDFVEVYVYGKDPFFNSNEKTASATVPVFGVKRGNCAFASIITKGDALARIRANRINDTGVSSVNTTFTITPVIASETSLYKGATYKDNICISYKFLSGNNAHYTAMASASREEFINKSILKSSGNIKNDDIPFCLTVVGKADSDKLTTTEQTLDILGILKGKGINNIWLNYKGLLSGGFAQKDLYFSSVISSLGRKQGVEELHEYTVTQGCKLLINTDIMSSSSAYIKNSARTADGKKAFFNLLNDLGYHPNTANNLVSRIGEKAAQLGKEKETPGVYSPVADYKMNLRKIETVGDKFSAFLESDMLSISDGLSFSDAGTVLYSSNTTDRETAKNIISTQAKAVNNYGTLAVENGNIYTLYGAELVSGLNFETYYEESSAYEPVPFVPAILHGQIHYTGKAVDAGDPLYRYDMLRLIEYGALPFYEWIYENKNIFCYSGYLLNDRAGEIADFYNDAKEIFTPLAKETITDHRKIEKDSDGKTLSGVYCTTYSDGTEIYVNYTGSIIQTPGNIAIGPYDFVAVKR